MRKQDDIDDEATSLQLPETTKVMVGPCAVEIQNIREMRLRRGIDDLGLRDEIRSLAIGSVVRLTLVTGPEPFTGAALLVRITHISGHRFQGELTRKPSGGGMSEIAPRCKHLLHHGSHSFAGDGAHRCICQEACKAEGKEKRPS